MTAAHQFSGNITEVLSSYSLKYSTSHLDGLMRSTITHYVAKYFVTWKLLEMEKYQYPFSQLQRTGYYFALHLFLSKNQAIHVVILTQVTIWKCFLSAILSAFSTSVFLSLSFLSLNFFFRFLGERDRQSQSALCH